MLPILPGNGEKLFLGFGLFGLNLADSVALVGNLRLVGLHLLHNSQFSTLRFQHEPYHLHALAQFAEFRIFVSQPLFGDCLQVFLILPLRFQGSLPVSGSALLIALACACIRRLLALLAGLVHGVDDIGQARFNIVDEVVPALMCLAPCVAPGTDFRLVIHHCINGPAIICSSSLRLADFLTDVVDAIAYPGDVLHPLESSSAGLVIRTTHFQHDVGMFEQGIGVDGEYPGALYCHTTQGTEGLQQVLCHFDLLFARGLRVVALLLQALFDLEEIFLHGRGDNLDGFQPRAILQLNDFADDCFQALQILHDHIDRMVGTILPPGESIVDGSGSVGHAAHCISEFLKIARSELEECIHGLGTTQHLLQGLPVAIRLVHDIPQHRQEALLRDPGLISSIGEGAVQGAQAAGGLFCTTCVKRDRGECGSHFLQCGPCLCTSRRNTRNISSEVGHFHRAGGRRLCQHIHRIGGILRLDVIGLHRFQERPGSLFRVRHVGLGGTSRCLSRLPCLLRLVSGIGERSHCPGPLLGRQGAIGLQDTIAKGLHLLLGITRLRIEVCQRGLKLIGAFVGCPGSSGNCPICCNLRGQHCSMGSQDDLGLSGGGGKCLRRGRRSSLAGGIFLPGHSRRLLGLAHRHHINRRIIGRNAHRGR